MTETRMVPLSALEHDPHLMAEPEQRARLAQIDDLMASIPSHGVLQSLKVRAWPEGAERWVKRPPKPAKGKAGKGKGSKAAIADKSPFPADVWMQEPAVPAPEYGVVAGNRRLAVLRRLLAEGGSILGVPVTADLPVAVLIGEADDATAFEQSQAENLLRLPPTPVGEFRAFAKMADKASPKEIAAHFGVPEKRVQQRLRLAALHPDVLAALEAGRLSMAAAEAFTVAADPGKQAAYLKKASDGWELEPRRIREALTDKLIRSDSPVARLIGKKAYMAAGGQLLGDIFDDKAYWLSPELVPGLLEAKWSGQLAAWLDEGWSFVETCEQFGKGQYGGWLATDYGRTLLKPDVMQLPEALAAERDELVARRAAMIAEHPALDREFAGDEPADWDSDEMVAKREAIEEIEEIEQRLVAIEEAAKSTGEFSAAQKARAGVVYWPDGSHEPVIGIVRPKKLGKQPGKSGGGKAAKPVPTLQAPGDARVLELSRIMTAALQRAVSIDADIALRVLVAGLHVRYAHGYDAPVKIGGDMCRAPRDEIESRGYNIVGDSRPAGNGFVAALEWAMARDLPQLLSYLAEIVGPNVGVERYQGSAGPAERALIDTVNPPVSFDAAVYFAAVSKPVVIEAWDEMHGEVLRRRGQAGLAGADLPEIPPFNSSGKKGDMAAAATGAATLTGWLPPQLRTPSYAGPGEAIAAPPAEADGDVEPDDEDDEAEFDEAAE